MRRRREGLVDEPGLPDARAPLDQQRAPLTAGQGLEAVHERGVLLVAADERQEVTAVRPSGSRSRRRWPSAATGAALPFTWNGASAVVANVVRDRSTTAGVA